MILGLFKFLVTGESKQNIREWYIFLKSDGCQFREGGDICLSEMGLLLRTSAIWLQALLFRLGDKLLKSKINSSLL